ncbi:TPA: small membrane protein [Klebsiella pneumoniae]|uniref:small membrane protein n=1 Tax=Klebsiella pneumoniae TaxID=573 RepID=UPI0028FB0F49|nr:small membrane protein [Klebsiella pneumoniae]MDT9753473.1 small membrane protein [Klebsiella pneumoniae]
MILNSEIIVTFHSTGNRIFLTPVVYYPRCVFWKTTTSTTSSCEDKMETLFFLGVAIVLFVVSIVSLCSYIRDRRRIKRVFISKRR